MEEPDRTPRTSWLPGLAALAIGASLGWTLAELVSSTLPSRPFPEHPVLPRANTVPPRRILPEHLAKPPCSSPVVEGRPRLRLVEVARGLSNPASLASPPEDSLLFVVEAGGRIVSIEGGRATSPPFLDLTGTLTPSPRKGSAEERGLGTLAFHPRYAQTGRLFLSYVDEARNLSRIVEIHVSNDPRRADPTSLFPLLEIPLPTPAQGPALLAFGPDGNLFIGIGDGGEPGDPRHLAQRTDSLLGKILRLDVDRAGTTEPYALPEGNLRGPRIRGEIWARGLRRPTSLGFDRHSGDLWLVDAGERYVDEIDVLPWPQSGLNLGWSFVEGSRCVGERACDTEGLHPPLVEFARDREGCEIVGGYVYRGCSMPGLEGEYFFGDRCGRIRSLHMPEGDEVPIFRDPSELSRVPGLIGFGEDAEGEVYVISKRGSVYRIEAE